MWHYAKSSPRFFARNCMLPICAEQATADWRAAAPISMTLGFAFRIQRSGYHIIGPDMALESVMKPYEALKGLARPFKTLEGPYGGLRRL